jgi:hypothetical protein
VAIPTVVGFGTPSGSSGDATPTVHASSTAGDDLWLCIEANGNQNPSSVTGYTLVDSSAGAGSGGTGVSVWHRKFTGSGDNPTVGDVGNHLYAVILTTRGGDATTPVDVSVDNREEVADTSGSATGLVTTVDDTLVVVVASTAADSTAPAWSSWTNASLSDFSSTSAFEGGTDAGGGGGLGINHGGKAAAGTVSATTMTTPNEHKAFVTFAIAPAGGTNATVTLPAAGILTVTSTAPAVNFSSSVPLPAAGILTMTSTAPAVNYSGTVTLPAAGVLNLTAVAPSIVAGTIVTLAAAGILRLNAVAVAMESVSSTSVFNPLLLLKLLRGEL